MKRIRYVLAVSIVPLVVVAGAAPRAIHGQTSGLRAPADFAGLVDREARSKALFVEASKVFQHPRCINCHPNGDRPLQGNGYPHQPPVQRGDAKGQGVTTMQCKTCHQDANFDPGRVPGHPDWSLAPATMAWQGKTLAEICAQVKDRDRNGGLDRDALVHHMTDINSLVGWAWNPGVGREPAPGSWATFGALIKAWNASGAECPTR